MVSVLFLVLTLSILKAQTAVLRNDNSTLTRVSRSYCDFCEYEHRQHYPHHHRNPAFTKENPAINSANTGTFNAGSTANVENFNRFDQHGYGGQTQESAKSSLREALNLAAEGRKAQIGCPTCGGSSNAISKAESENGNALAVAVG